MKLKCKCCLEEKEFNETFFPRCKVNGKIYLEKLCKKCKYKKGQERRKERYETDEKFREKLLNSTEQRRLFNQSQRNSTWAKRLKKTNEWRKNNKEKVKNHYKSKYLKYIQIPKNKINLNMKNLINSKLFQENYLFKYLGYTSTELRNHLEKLFKSGMSWQNRREWHIDHIKPLCSFDIKEVGDEEFIKCWSLNNLQPLWRNENLIKSQQDKLKKINP